MQKWPSPHSLPVCVRCGRSQKSRSLDADLETIVRTLKGIGVVNGAPAFESLSGFERFVRSPHRPTALLTIRLLDPKEICVVAPTRPVADTSPGLLPISTIVAKHYLKG